VAAFQRSVTNEPTITRLSVVIRSRHIIEIQVIFETCDDVTDIADQSAVN
jgi:hypothetical protein